MSENKLNHSNQPKFRTLLTNLEISTDSKVPVVIDSDAFNEVDDQFAIAWALLNPERLDVQAIYAAPYTNSFFSQAEQSNRCVSDPQEGMLLSFDEINKVIGKLKLDNRPPVFKGSTKYFSEEQQQSEAVTDLISRALNCDGVLQVVCISAPTNIVNAIALEPKIKDKIHVLWLGGHSFDWPNTEEFNLMQDYKASRFLLDCGVSLTLFPCMGTTSSLATSIPEIQYYLNNTSEIGTYLAQLAPTFPWISFASRKVIWDIANIGFLINPSWFRSNIVSSPILNENLTWSFDSTRHQIRVIKYIERDCLFKDLFRKLIDADN
ncbi:MAG: nucleoside hydrolase [Aliiglaciecola sp.]|uniref:nucleoside hydrolase n=1 Tax=Aliiglaciecola sp. TaxID=1872441 RepID=UPI00329928EF